MVDPDASGLWCGTWILVQELCLYEEGQPPRSGLYRINRAEREIGISISWEAQDGTTHAVEFHAPEDGVRQPAAGPGVSHFSITRISASILDSSAYAGEQEVMYARRTVSHDGLLLATVQVGRRQDGTSFRNFQVYRRQEGS